LLSWFCFLEFLFSWSYIFIRLDGLAYVFWILLSCVFSSSIMLFLPLHSCYWTPLITCFWSFDHDILHGQVPNSYCHYGLALDWKWVIASYIGWFWSTNAIIFPWQLSCLLFFENEKNHLRNQYMEEYHNKKVVKNIQKGFLKTLLNFE
jgi:hypothetical protein